MPFKVNYLSNKFANTFHPDIPTLRGILKVSEVEKTEIVRLYFTEGIPNVFLGNPVLYEKIRSYLGSKLNVSPKDISITGSGRLGFSLSPQAGKFGREFINSVSDLDFFVVNSTLFDRFSQDLSIYAQITNEIPRGQFFDSNLSLLQNTSTFGFLDQDKFPDYKIFPAVSEAYSIMRQLLVVMGDTQNCPQPKDASIRVYKDWDSCVNRITFNVVDSLERN